MIVITGASDGLGKLLAGKFVAAGKQVVNVSRSDSSTATRTIRADLATEAGIEHAADEIIADEEPIELLIHCAGVLSLEPIAELSGAEFDRLFALNVKAPMLLTSKLYGCIIADESDVVIIGSTAATRPHKEQATYDASKWALRGFTNDLRLELQATACRVIGVYPGMFDSEIAQKIPGKSYGKGTNPMSTDKLADLICALVALPKSMEVQDIIIDRKKLA